MKDFDWMIKKKEKEYLTKIYLRDIIFYFLQRNIFFIMEKSMMENEKMIYDMDKEFIKYNLNYCFLKK